jgi:hypothetical protein
MQFSTRLQIGHDMLVGNLQLLTELPGWNRGWQLPRRDALLLLGSLCAMHLRPALFGSYPELPSQLPHLRVSQAKLRQPFEQPRI